jgi:hypothetical protein
LSNKTICLLSLLFLLKCSKKIKLNWLSDHLRSSCINIIQNEVENIYLCIFGAEKTENKHLTFWKSSSRLFNLNALKILRNLKKKWANRIFFRHNKVIKMNKINRRNNKMIKKKKLFRRKKNLSKPKKFNPKKTLNKRKQNQIK